MFSEINASSRKHSPAYIAERSRFKDADTDALIALYEDVQRLYKGVNHALEHASAAQTLYFDNLHADARSCKATLIEIKSVLYARGVREFASTEG